MMSVSSMSSGSASSYFQMAEIDSKQPGTDEYYTKGTEAAGRWRGEGAAALGLHGDVTSEQFRVIADGYKPDGEKMVQNAGSSNRQAGWDLTMSAPKSVSVAMAVASEVDRKAIINAHATAVDSALKYLETELAYTRRGHAGTELERATLVVSQFQHSTSRNGDPQLHTHNFVHNVAVREDGTTGTIISKNFYDQQKVAGALYRAEFAHQLRACGFEVTRDGESFRMEVIPKEAEREFSTRRNEIKAELEKTGQSGAKASEIATLATRSTKNESATLQSLESEWKERAETFGITEASISAARSACAVELHVVNDGDIVMDIATQNTAVAREKDVTYIAAVIAQEGGGMKEAERLIEDAKEAAVKLENVHGKIGFTTKEVQQAEKDVAEWAERNASGGCCSVTAVEAVKVVEKESGFSISQEQRNAVQKMTGSERAVAMVGDAGTGKSTTMHVVREAYEHAGYKVIGAAPSAKAAAELEKSAGIKSQTIDSFNLRHCERSGSENARQVSRDLATASSPELGDRTVVVVDEAGMADARQIKKLTAVVEQAGAKIIMVGDTKQLQAIGAGAPFRAVVERVETARLKEIHRQRDDKDKQAVRDMSQGKAAEALGHYIAKGQVAVAQTHNKAVKEIAQKIVEGRDQYGEKQTVGLASTNKAVGDINKAVRDELKARGELKEGREFNAVRANGNDKWDGKESRIHERTEYAKGDRVVYADRNDKSTGLNRSDSGTVVAVSKDSVTVRMDKDGSERQINPSQKDLRHGYAVTIHKGQGMTVENAVVMVQAQNMSREMSYVQASRAKGETYFVTTRAQVSKMAETAPASKETSAMVKAIEEARVERGQAPALQSEHIETAKGAADYMRDYAPGAVAQGQIAGNKDLETLAEAAKGMAETIQAESTLDWREVMDKGNEQTQGHYVDLGVEIGSVTAGLESKTDYEPGIG